MSITWRAEPRRRTERRPCLQKHRKRVGRVDIPQEAFLAVQKISE